jgi:hypothetical protein
VIFFHNALHPDYHANTDEVSKILFDKMSRIAELIYATGVRLGNLIMRRCAIAKAPGRNVRKDDGTTGTLAR